MSELTIGAIADVHSPKFLEEFKRVLTNSPDVDLMLLAGDMIYKGKVDEYHNVLEVIRKRYDTCKVIACFGNEEYDDKLCEITERYNDVIWLNDDFTTIEVRCYKVNVVGTRGCLDRPTSWQRKNVPNIVQIYFQRMKKIDEILLNVMEEGDVTILLSHYSPTFKTLIGEPQQAWPELGSSRLEEVIRKHKPSIVIHGHAHNSKVHMITINSTQIYNVSFPATRKLTIIRLHGVRKVERQTTLMSFIGSNP